MKRNRLALMARAAVQAAAAPRHGAAAGFRTGALTALLGLALVVGVHAGTGNVTLNASGGPGGGVGTLPASAGDGFDGMPVGPLDPWSGASQVPSQGSPGSSGSTEEVLAPALALRGTQAELDHLIALAYSPDGTGWFHLESPSASGVRTITFYGNAIVLLERSALRANAQAPALSVAPSQVPMVAVVTAGDQHAVQALTPGLVPLPLDRLLGAGLLANGVVLEAVERGGATTAHVAFRADGPRILVEQRQ